MTTGTARRADGPIPTDDPWLWRLRREPAEPTATVLFLPHAGGTAASYATWAGHFPADVRLLAAQYPGRGPRYTEPHAGEVHEWVTPLERSAGGIAGPLALFGHSLGALVGFELAWRLQQRDRDVAVLVASAAPPPHLPNPLPRDGALSDEDLTALLETHGGLSPALLAEPEILALAVDGLRADLTIERNYDFGPEPRRLRCPIVVLGGDRDLLVPPGLCRAWAERSTAPADVHILPGGHFYLLDQQETVAALVHDRLPGRRRRRGER
ncbi:thioesterase [Dactylosporangium roseum]|uniref:Thioesterase n=1 Tax=Dactylosporangium roseum TaxID=47989 RepID=A0ABY5ZFS0_9ACTN|nr:alpha/beta fold hydrolase [Dactylosporangium roseum]UWZ39119.1 thioesterase [Dactylosporangium roseum]